MTLCVISFLVIIMLSLGSIEKDSIMCEIGLGGKTCAPLYHGLFDGTYRGTIRPYQYVR